MKPYGRNGKIELAPCGCCAAHANGDDLLPWRGRRDLFRKKDKHHERQVAKEQIERSLKNID